LKLQFLYPQKQLILNKINQFYISNQSGYLHVPTGWGKTFLSKHLIQQYLNNKMNVLSVVSQNNQLLTQTAFHEKLLAFDNSLVLSSQHEKADIKVIRNHLKSDMGCVIFASLQTLLTPKNLKIKELLRQKIDLLVVDEIHNFIKNRGEEFIQSVPHTCKIFGMTATPFQGILGNVKHVDEICDGMKLIHHESLLECINQNILSKISYTIIHSSQSIVDVFDFTRGLKELTKQELTMDCSTTRKLQSAIKRTKLAKKIYDTKVDAKTKTLVFCAPTQNLNNQKITSFHAKLSSIIFNGEPFIPTIPFTNKNILSNYKHAAYLTSDMPKDEQRELMESFQDLHRPPYVLCTVGMLIEGFNFPDLQNLILLRPTLSMRLFEQQVGRILRKPETCQKEWGNVYEVADDINALYSVFKYQIFNQDIAEQLQLLQPRIRVERLLFGSSRTACEDTSKIRIIEINDRDELTIVVKSSATNQQIEHLEKMIAMLDCINGGSMAQEKVVLQDVASRIRMYHTEDIYRVIESIKKLEVMAEAAKCDDKLSCNCKKNKPEVLECLAWLLKLNVAYVVERLPVLPLDRLKILINIGCNEPIALFKENCLHHGIGKSSQQIHEFVNKPFDDNWKGDKKIKVVLKKIFLADMKCYKNWLQFV